MLKFLNSIFSFSLFWHPVPLGSIPELPAESCLEIKASEGDEAASGYNWLDPKSNGEAIQIFCYFGTKG